MTSSDWWYCTPLFPVVVTCATGWCFRRQLSRTVDVDDDYRESLRGLYLGLTGFTMAALFAVAVVDRKTQLHLQLSVYFLLWAIFCFYTALNLVRYTAKKWQAELRDLLQDVGSLSILMSVSAVVRSTNRNLGLALTVLLAISWLADYGYTRWIFIRDESFRGRAGYETQTAQQETGSSG